MPLTPQASRGATQPAHVGKTDVCQPAYHAPRSRSPDIHAWAQATRGPKRGVDAPSSVGFATQQHLASSTPSPPQPADLAPLPSSTSFFLVAWPAHYMCSCKAV